MVRRKKRIPKSRSPKAGQVKQLKPIKLAKAVEGEETAAWRDCICEALGTIREECQKGMFYPFENLPCGLSCHKLIKTPREKLVRFCIQCGVPTKRSDYCSRCANERSREKRGLLTSIL